ncbi:hypothetical protein G7072_19465 [Nocardioides sp. HDW12B]|uniref:hypothetical protein n=1 Tax=Nocardioides sp. HDW12B TaxID=2714939 RepID=UPI00140DB0A8|nr:hypothetical protein [Nocardioides sp. HDW12B]QIK68227.1 hypothetical protein G7072_19465 [Nocardioides sp. HDW12B]
MAASRSPRLRAVLRAGCGAAVLLALVSSCSGPSTESGEPAVLDTGIEPVPLDVAGPTYAAAVPGGLLVRAGDEERVLPEADQARWLPGGTAMVDRSRRSMSLELLDVATGDLAPEEPVRIRGFDLPGRSVTQVNLLDSLREPAVLTAYSPGLERLWSLDLPDTDNPDAAEVSELRRGYYNVAPTIDGVTFVQWHDSAEDYEGGDYGVARIEDGAVVEDVLLNERIVALYLAADGAGLLALRQAEGEPCGGCVVDQEVVEIDPATGEVARDYGMPEEYVEEWRVAAMDKVGDRVAVRFTETEWREDPKDPDDVAPVTVQRGTWVYDGAWSVVEGSEDELTWWQGEDRVVARPAPREGDARDGMQLFWLHDGVEERLPGDLESSVGPLYRTGSVAGQLLPP